MRALVQVAVGEYVLVVANSIEALREKFPDGPTRKNCAVVLLADYPQPDLLAVFPGLRAPVAISIDDFESVALFSVVSRGFNGVAAARFATMGIVNVERAVCSPPPFSLFVGDPKFETLADLVRKLASLYKLKLKEDTVGRVLASVGFAKREEVALREYIDCKVIALEKMEKDARASLESVSPLDGELIDFLAPQYDAVARGQPLERLEWPVYALLRPEFPEQMTIGPIELTGPARYIYFGPYFALPAGAWRVDISLEVQGCYSDNQIAIDIFAVRILAIVTARLPPNGVYGCQIRFQVEDPSRPIEVRIQLVTGAIEGVMCLHAIALHRLGSLDEPDLDESFEGEPRPRASDHRSYGVAASRAAHSQ